MRRVVAVVALVLAAAPAVAAEWVRVESPHFVVFGEVGEKRTRDYATEFERFREALGRIVPGASARATVPTLVFIFNNQRSFGPYRPLFNGKPVEVSGYFARDRNLGVMMLAASNREAALRTLFHEYTHLVIANVARGLPAWLNEGLAEYYSTFEVAPDGRSALLGRPIVDHLLRLNLDRLLTIDELLAVRHDSPLYNEGARRSVFYAQSWALVHMLLNGERDRAAALRQYLQLVGGGTSAGVAWREVFGEAKVLEDLRRHVARDAVRGYRFTFKASIAPASFVVTRPSPDDALAALGDLRRLVTPERAAAHIESLTEGRSAYGAALRALAMVDRGEHGDALLSLREGLPPSDDWLVHYRAAVALERISSASVGDSSDAARQAGLAALDRVHAARPDLPHAHALRAVLLGPGDEGLAAIRRARTLAPGREEYALWEAQFHVDRGSFAEARQLLGPLLSPLFSPEVRDHARAIMGHAVQMQQARERAAAHPGGVRDPAGAPPPRRRQPGSVTYVFRELQPGEQRIEAVFERIECPRSGPVLHVRTEDRSLRFRAASLDAVEFIAYREDLAGAIACGPRTPPDRVYVTFTPATDGDDPTVIAIEFLPLKNGKRD